MKRFVSMLIAAALSLSTTMVLAAPPAQPDTADVTAFLTAAIPTLTGVAIASLALFISVKIFKWIRRAL